MARNLTTGLQRGLRRSIAGGLGASDLFSVASLDLRFAQTKALDSRITFTRASSGTYVGSDGLIKTATTNLLLRSEEFTLSPWTLFGTASRAADVTTAPNGTLTADSVTLPASSGIFSSTAAAANTTYTFSIWIRCDSTQSVRILINTNLHDPSTKTVTATTAWQRFDVTKTTSVGTTSWSAQVDTGGGNTFYLWGAQLEQSSTVGEYIPTTSTINSAPRFDHNPTTGESLGLLVEEQRTNEVRNSNSMSAVVTGSPGTLPTNWSAQGNANGWTREVVGSGSLGSLNYVDVRFSGTPTGGQFSVTFQSQGVVAASNGQTWAASVYYQLVGGSLGNVVGYPAANLWSSTPSYLSGLGLAGSIIPSATLQRYTGSGTISQASTAFISWGITFVYTAGNTYNFTIRFAGPQLELGAFSTSFVPTTGTAATRSADVASITGANFSSWYNQTEGTVFANASTADPSSVTPCVASINDGTSSNRIQIGRTNSSGAALRVFVIANGSTSVNGMLIGSTSANASGKIIFAFKSSDFSGAANGTLATPVTSGSVPTTTQFQIGNAVAGSPLNGCISRLTFWPQRLPNATLQQITR